jgi:hypothetical protein
MPTHPHFCGSGNQRTQAKVNRNISSRKTNYVAATTTRARLDGDLGPKPSREQGFSIATVRKSSNVRQICGSQVRRKTPGLDSHFEQDLHAFSAWSIGTAAIPNTGMTVAGKCDPLHSSGSFRPL